MNIETIKIKVRSLINEKIKVKAYLGRNKYEYFEGYIDKIHPNVFTIKTDKGLKSFAYSDVLIKNIVLSKFN